MKNRLVLFFICAFLAANSSCKKDIAVENPPIEVSESDGFVRIDEHFLTWEQEVTLRFDLRKGNGELSKATGDLYLHAGLITPGSSNASDWKAVATEWNKNNPSHKLKKEADGSYSFTFSPKQFFASYSATDAQYMAFLVRNADGTQVARNADGSDLYLPISFQQKLDVQFNRPVLLPTYVARTEQQSFALQEEIAFEILSSQKVDKISLYLGSEKIAEESGSEVLKVKYTPKTAGGQLFRARVERGGQTAERTLSVFVMGGTAVAELPEGVKANGITVDRTKNTISFAITAPNKQSIFLLGDFNGFKADAAYSMSRTPDGKTFWISLPNLDFNRNYTYQFLVDGQVKIADPYSELVLDPAHDASIPNIPAYPAGASGHVSVLNLTQSAYQWTNTAFTNPHPQDLVIYETLVRDFVQSHDYKTLTDSIGYFKRLGVNAVQMMPVQESEGNSTWGYNPSYHMALDKYYGTKQELKAFIDKCHSEGIAVILDVVLNHAFGQSPLVQLYMENGSAAANNPWLNAVAMHPFNVGMDFNHESPFTQVFVKDVLAYWITEYKVDGFRFDLSKGFTQKNSGTSDNAVGAWSAYDASRVAIWKKYNQYLKSLDNDFYVILEHFAEDREEQELANEGMLLWNNLNHAFNEATMGYASDFTRLFASNRGFGNANLISYMESHDEERIMFKNLQYGNGNGAYSAKALKTALERTKMAASFLLAAPGPKMIWQFGELGYDISIEYNGRTGEKPIHWEYLKDTDRGNLFRHFGQLIRMKKANQIFRNGKLLSSSLQGSVKYYVLEEGGQQVLLLGNFDVKAHDFRIPSAVQGTWRDNLTKDTRVLTANSTLALAPGAYYFLSKTLLNIN